jgi:hypothetical protein
VPALQQAVGGIPIRPEEVTIYYMGPESGFQAVRPFPPGFQMVPGDAMATEPQLAHTHWGCTGSTSKTFEVPMCPLGSKLFNVMGFPDCWNGRDLDAPDHQSHMRYRSNATQACPSSHPVHLPKLLMILVYPTRGGSDKVLASGGQYSMHADFMNAWDPTLLQSRIDRCIKAGIACDVNGKPF